MFFLDSLESEVNILPFLLSFSCEVKCYIEKDLVRILYKTLNSKIAI